MINLDQDPLTIDLSDIDVDILNYSDHEGNSKSGISSVCSLLYGGSQDLGLVVGD